MRILLCVLLATLVSGCIPIGIKGQNLPYRGGASGEAASVAVTMGR